MKPVTNFISVWFGVIMMIVVIGGAIAMTFTNVLNDRLFGNKRIFFIFLLFAYGVYRGFRLYHLLNQKKHHEE